MPDPVTKHQRVSIRLNEKVIRALELPAKGNRITYDAQIGGFGVRTTANGAKSFVLTYWVEGRQRRATVGKWPQWSTTAARERVKELKRAIDSGIDPLAEKEQRRGALTFGDLATQYLKKHAAKKRTGDEDRRQLEVDVLPKWKHRKAQEIKRRDVIDLIEAKGETAPIAANRLLACVRKVFNWAASKDLLPASPCVKVEAPGTENERDRVLNQAEIRQFWHRLDAPPSKDPKAPRLEMSPEVRTALKLILVLGQRPGEISGMEWAEIDGDWWTLPKRRTKANRQHRVPLTSLAKELLAGRERNHRFVFPAPHGDKPIQRSALAHALRRNRSYLGLEPFTAHDLRRSCSDWLARLKVDGRSRSAVLNHREAGVTEKHYTAYQFDDEKKAALEKWARKLREIISGKPAAKVVSIG